MRTLEGLRLAPQLRRLSVPQLLVGIRLGEITIADGALVPTIAGGAGSTSPIFTAVPNNGKVAVTAANTKSDGTATGIGTDIFLLFTAGANGSFVTTVRFMPVATAAATSTTATIARLFISTKSSGATTGGTDTFLVAEVQLPSVSADSSSAPVNPIEIQLNRALKSGETLLVTNHATPAASTSQQAVAFGGDY